MNLPRNLQRRAVKTPAKRPATVTTAVSGFSVPLEQGPDGRFVGNVSTQFRLVVVSEPNTREHWTKKQQRVSGQRNSVVAYELVRVKPSVHLLVGLPLARPVTVTLTRLGPRELDGDNLEGAFKAVRDEVASFLQVDDRDRRVNWLYAQDPDGRPLEDTEVRITFASEGRS